MPQVMDARSLAMFMEALSAAKVDALTDSREVVADAAV